MSQRIRIKLKSHDHNLVDKSAEKIVKTIKMTGAVVSGLFRFRPTRKSTLFCAPHSFTRNHVSSSSCHTTRDYWISTTQLLSRLML